MIVFLGIVGGLVILWLILSVLPIWGVRLRQSDQYGMGKWLLADCGNIYWGLRFGYANTGDENDTQQKMLDIFRFGGNIDWHIVIAPFR